MEPTAGDGLRTNEEQYFKELLEEMRQMNRVRDKFGHAASLLTAEITRVWKIVYKEKTEEEKESVRMQEKIPIPDHPNCNLIGRILGPNGLSVKQLEAETGCEIVIRGKGSVKDEKKEQRLIGMPGWEHLEEPLHVVITATHLGRIACENKLQTAVGIIHNLLTPRDDEYKKKQLIQLAIMKGTYRPRQRSSD